MAARLYGGRMCSHGGWVFVPVPPPPRIIGSFSAAIISLCKNGAGTHMKLGFMTVVYQQPGGGGGWLPPVQYTRINTCHPYIDVSHTALAPPTPLTRVICMYCICTFIYIVQLSKYCIIGIPFAPQLQYA